MHYLCIAGSTIAWFPLHLENKGTTALTVSCVPYFVATVQPVQLHQWHHKRLGSVPVRV